MPRTADHDARRSQIAAAVRRIVSESGLDAATVARVARSAEVSVGLVQHYFPAKDDLLLYAYEQVMADVGGRVAVRIAEGDTQRRRISDVVFGGLRELLPLDGQRRAEHRVIRAFLGRASTSPALAEVSKRTTAAVNAQLATAVTNGKECGEVEPAVDAELAAIRLSALADGLSLQVDQDGRRHVGGLSIGAAAEEVLRACVDGIFTGECRQYG